MRSTLAKCKCNVKARARIARRLDALQFGVPIATTVVDSQERQVDTMDSLCELRGNPGCDDQLQPGSEADMTCVYTVSASAQIVAFGFADATDVTNPSVDYTGVLLDL